jgi:hypothetical protein
LLRLATMQIMQIDTTNLPEGFYNVAVNPQGLLTY